jgi:hypothetical protein
MRSPATVFSRACWLWFRMWNRDGDDIMSAFGTGVMAAIFIACALALLALAIKKGGLL